MGEASQRHERLGSPVVALAAEAPSADRQQFGCAQPAAIHTRRRVKARRHVSGRMYVTGIAGAVTAYPKRAMPNIAKDVAMLREVLVSPERRDGSKAIAAKRGLLALAV